MEKISIQNNAEQHLATLKYKLRESEYEIAKQQSFIAWLKLYNDLDDISKLMNENKNIFNWEYTTELNESIQSIWEAEADKILDFND